MIFITLNDTLWLPANITKKVNEVNLLRTATYFVHIMATQLQGLLFMSKWMIPLRTVNCKEKVKNGRCHKEEKIHSGGYQERFPRRGIIWRLHNVCWFQGNKWVFRKKVYLEREQGPSTICRTDKMPSIFLWKITFHTVWRCY